MPRPPVLPTINWKDIVDSGKDFDAWLAGAESRENAQRIEDDRSTFSLPPHVRGFLEKLGGNVHVVAIAEDWCGDVWRHVPVLQRMADHAPNLEVRYIARDQHPDVFARFLTNGGEAIPRFIFLSADFVECGNWGPMPQDCRERIARGKACGDLSAARKKVSALYEADSSRRNVAAELLALIDIAASTEP